MISIVNTECHVPKTFSDLAKIAAWGRLGQIKGTQTAKVRAPLIGDREGFVLSCDGTKRLPVWRFGNRVGWLYLSIG